LKPIEVGLIIVGRQFVQELIRRWDSEREHFNDHIVQYFKI